PIEQAALAVGPAMGDALARGLGRSAIAVQDALGGGFRLRGDAIVAERRAGAAGDAGAALARFFAGDAATAGPRALAARDLAGALAWSGGSGWGGVAGSGGTAAARLLDDGLAVAAPLGPN